MNNSNRDLICLDDLSSDELRSILKSNELDKHDKRFIEVKIGIKLIEEFIPAMMCFGISNIILNIMKNEDNVSELIR